MKQQSFRVKLDTSTCSFCEVCVRRCPTGALTLRADGKLLELLFEAPFCHGCHGDVVCQEVCPEKSIEVVREETPAAGEPAVLIRGEMAECPDCGKPFAPLDKIQAVRKKPKVEEQRYQGYCVDCRRNLLLENYPTTPPPGKE